MNVNREASKRVGKCQHCSLLTMALRTKMSAVNNFFLKLLKPCLRYCFDGAKIYGLNEFHTDDLRNA